MVPFLYTSNYIKIFRINNITSTYIKSKFRMFNQMINLFGKCIRH